MLHRSTLNSIFGFFCTLLVTMPCAAASFQGLNVGSPMATYVLRNDPQISGDGSTVVCNLVIGDDEIVPARWTAQGGLSLIYDWPAAMVGEVLAYDVSSDGTVIVGRALTFNGPPDAPWGAYRWTADSGFQTLATPTDGMIPAMTSMCSDGSVAYGNYTPVLGIFETDSFRWTAAGGLAALNIEGADPDVLYSIVGCGDDGNMALGRGGDSWRQQTEPCEAFVWTPEGTTWLQPLAGRTEVDVQLLSGDGATIIGSCWWNDELHGGIPKDYSPVIWKDGSVEALSNWDMTWGHDISRDGSIAVGTHSGNRWSGPTGPTARIWDEVNGTRDVADVLAALGLSTDGWTLEAATGISDDGMTIVGYGTNPQGVRDAWMATIPEPATMLLLSTGAMTLLRRRRMK